MREDVPEMSAPRRLPASVERCIEINSDLDDYLLDRAELKDYLCDVLSDQFPIVATEINECEITPISSDAFFPAFEEMMNIYFQDEYINIQNAELSVPSISHYIVNFPHHHGAAIVYADRRICNPLVEFRLNDSINVEWFDNFEDTVMHFIQEHHQESYDPAANGDYASWLDSIFSEQADPYGKLQEWYDFCSLHVCILSSLTFMIGQGVYPGALSERVETKMNDTYNQSHYINWTQPFPQTDQTLIHHFQTGTIPLTMAKMLAYIDFQDYIFSEYYDFHVWNEPYYEIFQLGMMTNSIYRPFFTNTNPAEALSVLEDEVGFRYYYINYVNQMSEDEVWNTFDNAELILWEYGHRWYVIYGMIRTDNWWLSQTEYLYYVDDHNGHKTVKRLSEIQDGESLGGKYIIITNTGYNNY